MNNFKCYMHLTLEKLMYVTCRLYKKKKICYKSEKKYPPPPQTKCGRKLNLKDIKRKREFNSLPYILFNGYFQMESVKPSKNE